MWTGHQCILTTKDFTILEVLCDRSFNFSVDFAALLRAKLDGATVIFREDVNPNVATLNSRVRFSLGDEDPQTRIISHDQLQGFVGMTQPLTTLRGLALLGLQEGATIPLPAEEPGVSLYLRLEKVIYQPEAERRKMAGRSQSRPRLRLVHSADANTVAPAFSSPIPGDDDPGPGAA